MFKIVTIAAAALATLAPTASFAREAPRQLQISFNDLNLSTEAGKTRLNRRIEIAVRKVCAEDDFKNLKSIAAARACESKAREGVQDAVKAAIAARGTSANVKTAAR
jgi:UrcA family protein